MTCPPPPALAPGRVVGILGGGQLARMLALAAAPMGLRVHVLAPEPRHEAPAAPVVARYVEGSFDDEEALRAFAASVDAVTCEFENVPASALELLAGLVPVRPGAKSFAVAQDRAAEKRFAAHHGAATVAWAPVDDAAGLDRAIAELGLPLRLKTRRLGYDGKGQARLCSAAEAPAALARLGGRELVAECELGFDGEFSILCARSGEGRLAFWPPIENRHVNGVLAESRVPARLAPSVAAEAMELAGRMAHALDHVGVLALEFFLAEGRALFSEMAPRVHNSGHWTIEGSPTSQFAQHLRCVAGWPLGESGLRGREWRLCNLLGDEVDRWAELAAEPGTSLHLYGKPQTAPGRKMGHVTRGA